MRIYVDRIGGNMQWIKFTLKVLIITILYLDIHAYAMCGGGEDYEEELGFTPLPANYQPYHGTPLSQAYAPPHSNNSEKKKSLGWARQSIDSIRKIRDFDSTILSGKSDWNQLLDFEGLDLTFGIRVMGFYSEVASDRKYKFQTEIKSPLLEALKDASKFSYEFPQTLKYLSHPSVISSPFLDAALIDIFTNDPLALNNLAQALRSLDETESLSKEEKDSLFLFRKVAGYFYDRKALEHLKEEMSKFFVSHTKEVLDFADPLVRFGLLRILQWSGEFLKLLLPSTLNLSTDLPEDELMKELRDQHLSHITKRKLQLVATPSKEVSCLFQAIYDDVKFLADIFASIFKGFPLDDKFSSPLEHWLHVKQLSELRTTGPSAYEWKGLKGLRDLFTYSKTSLMPPTISCDNEVQMIMPLPYSESERRHIRQTARDAKVIWDILGNDEIKDVASLNETLQKSLNKLLDKGVCEEFWEAKVELKKLQESIFEKLKSLREQVKEEKNRYLEKVDPKNKKVISIALDKPTNEKAIQKAKKLIQKLKLDESEFDGALRAIRDLMKQIDEENKAVKQNREELKQKLQLLKEETRAKILKDTPEKIQKTLERNKEIEEAEKNQKTLTARLTDSKVVKPSYGHRNFTDTFRDFCAFLKDQGVQIEGETYSWFRTALSPVEQLFYKAHFIPISSPSDKHKHRYERTREFIRIINFIKNLVQITTDLRLETEKDAFKDFASGKSRLMSELLHNLGRSTQASPTEDEPLNLMKIETEKINLGNLWLLQEKLLKLESQVIPSLSSCDLIILFEKATEIISQFLIKLKESNFLEEKDYIEFEKELKDRVRSEKKRQLMRFVKKEQVKSNPRPHEPVQISRDIEEVVKGNPLRYLAYEFLVAAFYELFKEVNDYPELSVLKTSDKVRNFFFHTDPFNSEPLIVGGLFEDANIRINNSFGQLAKEMTILTVNTKFLLEEFLLDMMKYDSQTKTSTSENTPNFSQHPPQKPVLPQPRHFGISLLGKEFALKEVIIPGNGDCGYLALETTRAEAVKVLLVNSHKPEIRALVAHEIYDMFATLPEEMMHTEDKSHPYQQILFTQERMDHDLQKLLSSMNDLIKRPEGDRWSEDVLLEYYTSKESEGLLNEEQQEALRQLAALREKRRKLEELKQDYCNSEETFKEYVTFYMQPTVIEYLMKYGESNWLNTTNVEKRTSSADALAYLMGKNLVILNEEGLVEHEYFAPDTPIEDTLFLLHIGNWHFNRLM